MGTNPISSGASGFDPQNQTLTLGEFAEISPWSANADLDVEALGFAQDLYDATLGSRGTAEDKIYLTIQKIGARASQMLSVFLAEPGAPQVSFDVVYSYLKERVGFHIHDIIWKNSYLMDAPYNFTPNDQLVYRLMRDEMFTDLPESTPEAVDRTLNDDYYRCMDLWQHGERTVYASADVERWVGVLRSFDASEGLTEHPMRTVSIGAFAAYTAPISWTYALLWAGGGIVNAGIQAESARIDLDEAARSGSRDLYETAYRGQGQAIGTGAQAAMPVVARYMASAGAAEQPGTALAPRTSTATGVVATEPELVVIPAPKQIAGPVPEPVAAASRVVTTLGDGTEILAPKVAPKPSAKFDHPVAPDVPNPDVILRPTAEGSPGARVMQGDSSSPLGMTAEPPELLTKTVTPTDQVVADLLGPRDAPQLPVLASAAKPAPTAAIPPMPAGYDPLAYAAAVPAIEDVLPTDGKRPGDAFDGTKHPSDRQPSTSSGAPVLVDTKEHDDDGGMKASPVGSGATGTVALDFASYPRIKPAVFVVDDDAVNLFVAADVMQQAFSGTDLANVAIVEISTRAQLDAALAEYGSPLAIWTDENILGFESNGGEASGFALFRGAIAANIPLISSTANSLARMDERYPGYTQDMMNGVFYYIDKIDVMGPGLTLMREVVVPRIREQLDGGSDEQIDPAQRTRGRESAYDALVNPLDGKDQMLAGLMGPGSRHRMVDFGTGNGRWLYAVLGNRPAWLAEDATVSGVEIVSASKRPDLATISRGWGDLPIALSSSDPKYPEAGSVDFLHEAFIELEETTPEELYAEEDRLLAPGGWLVVVRNLALNGDSSGRIDFLRDRGYDVRVVSAVFPDAISDYPRETNWWDITTSARPEQTYFIIAQKPQDAPAAQTREPAETEFTVKASWLDQTTLSDWRTALHLHTQPLRFVVDGSVDDATLTQITTFWRDEILTDPALAARVTIQVNGVELSSRAFADGQNFEGGGTVVTVLSNEFPLRSVHAGFVIAKEFGFDLSRQQPDSETTSLRFVWPDDYLRTFQREIREGIRNLHFAFEDELVALNRKLLAGASLTAEDRVLLEEWKKLCDNSEPVRYLMDQVDTFVAEGLLLDERSVDLRERLLSLNHDLTVRAMNTGIDLESAIGKILSSGEGVDEGSIVSAGAISLLDSDDFGHVIKDALAFSQRTLDQNGVIVRHGVQNETYSTRIGSPDQVEALRDILMNLLTNAARYSNQELPAGQRTAAVRTELQPNGDVLVEVSDNGIGMLPENIARIGEFGFREARQDVAGSHGFGLSSVVEQIRENGWGPLWVQSIPGEGTTWRFVIPAQNQTAPVSYDYSLEGFTDVPNSAQ